MNLCTKMFFAFTCQSVFILALAGPVDQQNFDLKNKRLKNQTISEEVKCLLLNMHNNFRRNARENKCMVNSMYMKSNDLEWSDTLAESALQDAELCLTEDISGIFNSKLIHEISYNLFGGRDDEVDALIAILAVRDQLEANDNPSLFRDISKMGCAMATTCNANTAATLVCHYDLDVNSLNQYFYMYKGKYGADLPGCEYEKDALEQCQAYIVKPNDAFQYHYVNYRYINSNEMKPDIPEVQCKSRTEYIPGAHKNQIFCKDMRSNRILGWVNSRRLKGLNSLSSNHRSMLPDGRN